MRWATVGLERRKSSGHQITGPRQERDGSVCSTETVVHGINKNTDTHNSVMK